MTESSTSSYIQPVGSLALRDRILRSYINCIDDAAQLEKWMLKPYPREGGLRHIFDPFFSDFRTLYLLSSTIKSINTYSKVIDKGGLKEKIERWNNKSTYLYALYKARNKQKNRQTIDSILKEGVSLFVEWSQILADKGVIEFR